MVSVPYDPYAERSTDLHAMNGVFEQRRYVFAFTAASLEALRPLQQNALGETGGEKERVRNA